MVNGVDCINMALFWQWQGASFVPTCSSGAHTRMHTHRHTHTDETAFGVQLIHALKFAPGGETLFESHFQDP